uniref:RING-type domain-containing protein n=1 Tax=Spongospora subterranea TaxID=70186 RepID=A0A0H5QFF3_9EUKA|eukprot:CRZ00680.1 hypothetical protein [Spongospora subterranea]
METRPPRIPPRGLVFGMPFHIIWVYVDVGDERHFPKTAQVAIEALCESTVASVSSCAVCFEDFVVGSKALTLPCDHFFHRSCILPWLERQNTCPLCRYELPTEPVLVNEMDIESYSRQPL